MADYLFRSIPGIVFEPFFVCALIWCVLILPFFRKNNKILFRGIFVAVIMMTVWRLVLHHVVISARYSVILVYPLMAVSACLCIKISPFGIWIMKKCKMQSGIARICIRFFSTVAVVGLSIACLCNALRFNQYEDAYKKIGVDCSKYRERAGQYHIIEKEYKAYFALRSTDQCMSSFRVLPFSDFYPKEHPLSFKNPINKILIEMIDNTIVLKSTD